MTINAKRSSPTVYELWDISVARKHQANYRDNLGTAKTRNIQRVVYIFRLYSSATVIFSVNKHEIVMC